MLSTANNYRLKRNNLCKQERSLAVFLNTFSFYRVQAQAFFFILNCQRNAGAVRENFVLLWHSRNAILAGGKRKNKTRISMKEHELQR